MFVGGWWLCSEQKLLICKSYSNVCWWIVCDVVLQVGNLPIIDLHPRTDFSLSSSPWPCSWHVAVNGRMLSVSFLYVQGQHLVDHLLLDLPPKVKHGVSTIIYKYQYKRIRKKGNKRKAHLSWNKSETVKSYCPITKWSIFQEELKEGQEEILSSSVISSCCFMFPFLCVRVKEQKSRRMRVCVCLTKHLFQTLLGTLTDGRNRTQCFLLNPPNGFQLSTTGELLTCVASRLDVSCVR